MIDGYTASLRPGDIAWRIFIRVQRSALVETDWEVVIITAVRPLVEGEEPHVHWWHPLLGYRTTPVSETKDPQKLTYLRPVALSPQRDGKGRGFDWLKS